MKNNLVSAINLGNLDVGSLFVLEMMIITVLLMQ